MIRVGLEVCLERPPAALEDAKRFALLMNQASVDAHFTYAHRLLADRFPGRLVALFSPQHGFHGERQDNMIESDHEREPTLGIPVYSLYSETRTPTAAMLAGLDTLVIDLQDVGTRVYTFIWTALLCLRACAERGIRVVVLDRPNPLGGTVVEGDCLDPEFTSFVGLAPIPMRYALTIGELLLWLNAREARPAALTVVPMEGWQRSMRFAETGRVWVPPSPNLPRIEGVDVYPGQVLIEGTNLSEGRGTTTPFEIVGAPFVDPERLLRELEPCALPGITFRPVRFEPTFQKWVGHRCGGLFLHVWNPEAFRPYRTTVAILAAIRRLWPDDFAWLAPPYEYEPDKMPIDILSGATELRQAVDEGAMTAAAISAASERDAIDWDGLSAGPLLYP